MARTNGEVLVGQQYDEQTDVVVRFTEQVENFERGTEAESVGVARTEVTPIDAASSRVRTYTAPVQGVLDGSAMVLFENVSFSLPDTLQSVTAYYTAAVGDGVGVETGDGQSTGTTGSLSINLNASSQGSASLAGDVFIKILPTSNWAVDVPASVYLFYIADTSTRAQILTAVSALAGGYCQKIFRRERRDKLPVSFRVENMPKAMRLD